MFKAFIFDLDGTIIDTPKLIMACFKYALKENGNFEINDDDVTDVLGQTLERAFLPFANDLQEVNKMIESFREYSYKHGNNINVYEGVLEILDELKAKGKKILIVTSKSRPIALANLKALKIEHYFDLLVTYEDTKLHKPAADPIIYALNKLKIETDEAIYIGDHENDVVAGKNAKIKTGLMNYSYRYKEAVLKNPDYIFSGFSNIKVIIK